jgi:hypothetical protein
MSIGTDIPSRRCRGFLAASMHGAFLTPSNNTCYNEKAREQRGRSQQFNPFQAILM